MYYKKYVKAIAVLLSEEDSKFYFRESNGIPQKKEIKFLIDYITKTLEFQPSHFRLSKFNTKEYILTIVQCDSIEISGNYSQSIEKLFISEL